MNMLGEKTPPDAPEPRTHARSHVLLGIDFTRPLQLPECARYYDRFDRPEANEARTVDTWTTIP